MRTSLLLLIGIAFCFTSTVDAQIRFLPYIGYATNVGYDFEAASTADAVTGGIIVGVGTEFGLTPGILPVALKVRPSVETTFLSGDTVDGVDISESTFRGNMDLIVDFSPPMAPVGVYAGAGVAYMSYKASDGTDEDASGSAFGVNLLAGARFGGGFISPFVQGRYTIGGPTPDEFMSDMTGTNDTELGNSIAVQVGVSIGL